MSRVFICWELLSIGTASRRTRGCRCLQQCSWHRCYYNPLGRYSCHRHSVSVDTVRAQGRIGCKGGLRLTRITGSGLTKHIPLITLSRSSHSIETHTKMTINFARRGHPPSITQFYRQGSLYPEDALPGRDDPSSVRTRGFHRTPSSPCAKAESQSHAIPWGPCPEPSLARTGHTSQAWQRRQVYLQCASPLTW